MVLAVVAVLAVDANADDVILNPGTLSGSVSLTGYDITSVTVRAIDTTKNYSATVTASVPAGAASIDYILTVEGDNDYYVIADVYVSAIDTVRALIPPADPVNVPIGVDVPLNLSMEPAIISGTISTISSDNTITQFSVYAYITLPDFETSNSSYTSAYNLSVPGDTGRDYTLLVAPQTEYYQVRGYITVDGLNYNIYDYNVTTLAAGVTMVRDYTIDVTSATISGFALLQGIDVTYASVHGYANVPPPSRNANFVIPDLTTGEYTLAVDAGDWQIRPRFNFNLPDDDPNLAGLTGSLQLAYSPVINVNPGDELTVDFDINPGFIPGTLNLWGANTNFSWGQVRAYGYNPNGGSLYSYVDPDTGKFLFVCSPGDWQTDNYQYLYFDYPDDPDASLRSYVNQSYYSNANLQTVTAGQTAEPTELTYGTITVRRYFYVAGDGILSSPYINATRSESPSSRAWGYGSPAATTEGQAIVTLLLPGSYSLEAFATVDGSDTEFGTINITVEEGDVVVIGGTARPTIKVTNPTDEEIICGDKVTVEGTATDDVGVASITINGEDVEFASTGNPDDPNEVGFSHEITLNIDDENTITVIVSDVDQTDPVELTMTVFSESCGPDVIECAVDIKPGTCPNHLNVKNKGVLLVAILGTDDFDVTTIDLNTIQLMGIAPVWSDYKDVGTPLDCTEESGDGITDLMLKFDRQQIVQALGEVVDGEVITLTLTGNLLVGSGGNEINGEDMLIIMKKGQQEEGQ